MRPLAARYARSHITEILPTARLRLPREVFSNKILILQWDILSNGGAVQEMAHIANGRDHGNCVSLLRVNVSACLVDLYLILILYERSDLLLFSMIL
jgi:hypothetical protein